MKHARPDYDRIQDPEGKIPEDEPVFLLRGQDPSAPTAVRVWALVARDHGVDPDMTDKAHSQAEAMEQWQADHQEAVHPADL